ncbi:MAG TPA: nucleotidyltransferase family protein, partial [Chthoniobacteraceae bacterium]|nr:nucleotidyltransferase family protein [Chthoniobacteraceae bacterium]
MKQAVILAGGKGTRLKERFDDLPKPLVPIGGKPLLEYQIALAQKHGFGDILVFTCYRSALIEAALGDGSRWGVRIRYQVEQQPLGTAGAVLAGFEQLADSFLVLYGDTMVEVDLGRIWHAHQRTGADATLLLHPNDHPMDSDLVETDASSRILAIHRRPHPANRYFQNLVNAGLYVIKKQALRPWRECRESMDFGQDLLPIMLKRGLEIYGYNSPEFIKDIGTPERYDRVNAQLEAGIVQHST